MLKRARLAPCPGCLRGAPPQPEGSWAWPGPRGRARAGGARGGGGDRALQGRAGQHPQRAASCLRPRCLCCCWYSLALQHTAIQRRREKHPCRPCPRRASAGSRFISAVCAQAPGKFSSASSVTEHLIEAYTANVISLFFTVMLLNTWSSSFKSRVFQLYEAVLALPAAFYLEDLRAGRSLAMVIEYKVSHRKRVIFQEHCDENEEIKLQVHVRAVAALSLSFFLLSLIVMGKHLSCPLGFFVTICLAPVMVSIVIITYCRKVLDKFSYFDETSAVNAVAFPLFLMYFLSTTTQLL